MRVTAIPNASSSLTSFDRTEPAAFLTPGTILQDRYRILRRLGKGGMGAVYEAVDQRLDTTVALKETFSADDRLRRQFAQEARLLAQLSHPGLPRVSDYFTDHDRAFLVMQFISGADLAEIIATQPGPFPAQQVIAWADQLLDVLIYLHTRDRQIIHRDIKPHNLKLTSNGKIALLDFGLAKAENSDLSGANTSTSIFGYTRRYSPLEQIQDQGTTPQSDIYALGATLYHLITGVKPADALTRASALAESKLDPLFPANELHGVVGSQIASILRRAMAIGAEDRYQTAAEFRQALRQLGRDSQISNAVAEHSNDSKVEGSAYSTVTRKGSVDPFDSYSILKPDETSGLVPKHRRRPGAFAAVAAVLLIAFGIFASDARWIDAAESVFSYARIQSEKESAEKVQRAPSVQQNKDDRSSVVSAPEANVPRAPSVETGPKNEKPKTRISRTKKSHRIPQVPPPRFSIAP